MNEKVLVEIFVPAANKKFDVFIPWNSKMSDVLKMAALALSELSDGKYLPTEDTVLCSADTGMIYNINMAVADLGIKNGTRLMLI